MRKFLLFVLAMLLVNGVSAFDDSERIDAFCTYDTADTYCTDTWTASCDIIDYVVSSEGISSVKIFLDSDDISGVYMDPPVDLLNGTWTYSLGGYNTHDRLRIESVQIENSVGVKCTAKNNQQISLCRVIFDTRAYSEMTCEVSCNYTYEYDFQSNDLVYVTVIPSQDCDEQQRTYAVQGDFCVPNWVPIYECNPDTELRYNEFGEVVGAYLNGNYDYYYETRTTYPLKGFANKTFIDTNSCCALTEGQVPDDCAVPLGEDSFTACSLDYWNAEGKASSLDRYNNKYGPVDESFQQYTGVSSAYLKPAVFDINEDRFNDIIFFSDDGYVDIYSAELALQDSEKFSANFTTGANISTSEQLTYDLSNATYDGATYFQNATWGDFFGSKIRFSTNGDYMFLSKGYPTGGKGIYTYFLPDPWNISSINYSDYNYDILGFNAEYYLHYHFKDDGTKLYVSEGWSVTNAVKEYTLSTPWAVGSRDAGTEVLNITQYLWDFGISADGLHVWAYASTGDCTTDTCNALHIYTLSQPWNLSSVSGYANKSIDGAVLGASACPYVEPAFELANQTDYPMLLNSIGAWVSPDGNRFYIFDDDEELPSDGIVEFTMSVSWDPTTLSMDSYDQAIVPATVDPYYAVNGNFGWPTCDQVFSNELTSIIKNETCSEDFYGSLQPYYPGGITTNNEGTKFYAFVFMNNYYCNSPYNYNAIYVPTIHEFSTGFVSSTSQVASLAAQPVLVGVNEYQAGEQVSCYGEPTVCREYVTQGTCEAAPGCWYDGTTGGIVGPVFPCRGDAWACERHDSEYECSQSGCTWGIPTERTAYDWGGGAYIPSTCEDTLGAYAYSNACLGTPPSCFSQENQTSCEAAGCTWKMLTPFGTPLNFCVGEPTSCKEGYLTEGACNAVDGCYWGKEIYDTGSSCGICNSVTSYEDRTACCSAQPAEYYNAAFCVGVSSSCSALDFQTEAECLAQGCTPGFVITGGGPIYDSCTGTPTSCYDASFIDNEAGCVAIDGCSWDERACRSTHAIFAVNGEVEQIYVGGETILNSGLRIEGEGIISGGTQFEFSIWGPNTDSTTPDITTSLLEGQTNTYTIEGVDYEVTLMWLPDNAQIATWYDCDFSSCSMKPIFNEINAISYASIVNADDGYSFVAKSYLPGTNNGVAYTNAEVPLKIGTSTHGVATNPACSGNDCYFVSMTSTQSPTFYLWDVGLTAFTATTNTTYKQVTGLPAIPLNTNISGIGDMGLIQTDFGEPHTVVFTINYVDAIYLAACPIDFSKDCIVKEVDVATDNANSTLLYGGLALGDYYELRNNALVYVTVTDVQYSDPSDWIPGYYELDGTVCYGGSNGLVCRTKYTYIPGYWNVSANTYGYNATLFFAALQNDVSGGIRWNDTYVGQIVLEVDESLKGQYGTETRVSPPAIGPCSGIGTEGVATSVFLANRSAETAKGVLYCNQVTRDSLVSRELYSVQIPEFSYDTSLPNNEVALVDVTEDGIAEIVTSEGAWGPDGSFTGTPSIQKFVDFKEYGLYFNNTNYVIPIDLTSEGYMDFVASTSEGVQTLLSVPRKLVTLRGAGNGTYFEECAAEYDSDMDKVYVQVSGVQTETKRENITYTATLTFGGSPLSSQEIKPELIVRSVKKVDEQELEIAPPGSEFDETYSVFYTVYDESAIGSKSYVGYCGDVVIPSQLGHVDCNMGEDGEFEFASFADTGWAKLDAYFPSLSGGIATLIGGDDIIYNITCLNEVMWLSGRIRADEDSSGEIFLKAYNSRGEEGIVGGIYIEGRDVYLGSSAGYDKVLYLEGDIDWFEFSLEFLMDDNRYVLYQEGYEIAQSAFIQRANQAITGLVISRDYGTLDVDYIRLNGTGEKRIVGIDYYTQYALQPLGNCVQQEQRDFEQQPAGTIGQYSSIGSFCSRLKDEGANKGYCTLAQLKDSIAYNPDCYQEAVNYCQAWTYPLSDGFDDFTKYKTPVLTKSTVEGTYACVSALTASATTTNVLAPLFNGLWDMLKKNWFVSILLFFALLILIIGLVLFKGGR